MSFQLFSSRLSDALMFFDSPPNVEDHSKVIFNNTKFVTAFVALKTGISAFHTKPTPKNRAKAWGAFETFFHFLNRNLLDSDIFSVSPFEQPFTDLKEFVNSLVAIDLKDFSHDIQGLFFFSVTVNITRAAIQSSAYKSFNDDEA